MGVDGATGHLYICGSHELSKGECTRHMATQGRKVKAVYGNYGVLLALCDGWELEWMSPEATSIAKSLHDVKVHQLAFGKAHTAALSLDGQIFVWGDGEFGQLGMGATVSSSDRPLKLRQSNHLTFTSVACGGYHTAAISNGGDLYTWGRNFEGQLGHSSQAAQFGECEVQNGVFHHPKHVSAFLNTKCHQVACGEHFTAVLSRQGDIYAFGEGQSGQLGIGRCTKSFIPRKTLPSIDATDPFVEIACGWAHALAVSKSGRLFAWGFNQYGQLGLGDTTSRFLPEEILSCHQICHVYASGNYSAAITRDGRLLSWGNGSRGKLGHGHEQHVLQPKVVDSVKNLYVQSAACSWDNMLAFAPTWISDVQPKCGPLEGGIQLSIFGSGFWESDDLTVRFVPLTEGRLPRAVLATFNVQSGIITCELPKFSVPGIFAVEVAMNGKHFTMNNHEFEVYVPPTCTFISHNELSLEDHDAMIHLHFQGEKPKSALTPCIRWVSDNPCFVPCIVPAVYDEIDVETNENQEERKVDDVEPREPSFMMKFPPPQFTTDIDELVVCRLETSFNGQDFVPVRIPSNAASAPPQVVCFHKAAIKRCSPNSMAFSDKKMTMEIQIAQLFDIGKFVCKARYSEPENKLDNDNFTALIVISRETPYSVATANLSVVAVKVSDQVLQCIVPPFSEWAVQIIAPVVETSDTEEDDKPKKPAPPPKKLSWYQSQKWLQAEILVSLNGGLTFLPPATPFANILHGYTHGELEEVQPTSGPISGGTIVRLTASNLLFDTEDSTVAVEYEGDVQTVSSYIRTMPESNLRCVTFQIPSFETNVATTSGQGPNQPALQLKPANLRLSLNGLSFGESTVSFEFYKNPYVRSIEPQIANPGALLHITGSFFKTTPTIKGKLEKEGGSYSVDVIVDYREEKAGPCYKVEVPKLGAIADGELYFYVALNGQQYATSEFAKFVYADQPEAPPSKEDKKKH
ncbi:unnamed protein product [Aphanomyces euteiches]